MCSDSGGSHSSGIAQSTELNPKGLHGPMNLQFPNALEHYTATTMRHDYFITEYFFFGECPTSLVTESNLKHILMASMASTASMTPESLTSKNAFDTPNSPCDVTALYCLKPAPRYGEATCTCKVLIS